MLSILRHPNIVLLMGICSKKHTELALVFENCPKGSLYNILHMGGPDVPLPTRLKIARDVASAYTFIHASGIVHRDLKSLNILVDEAYNVKICDFGLARFKSDLNTGYMQFSGTPAYMAPEQF